MTADTQAQAQLAILNNFASKDRPGRQGHIQQPIQQCVDRILTVVGGSDAAPADPA
jgi:hypothetical protein